MKVYNLSSAARKWIEVLLEERFGHEWLIDRNDECLTLKLQGGEGAIIFDRLEECFSEARSDIPFTMWCANQEGWKTLLVDSRIPAPGIANLPSPLIQQRGTDHVIHYDVLGFTYWMMARVEEIGRTDLDWHRRFPATASHAYKFGYLGRPVVDEWLYVLSQVILAQWPGIELKRNRFQMSVSHDVDHPSRYGFAGSRTLFRRVVGSTLRGRLQDACIGLWIRGNSSKQLHPSDPYNTFEWLMDNSEKHNLKSTFYFLSGMTNPKFDGDYTIEHPAIRLLLRRIHARGHEIGLHPSYGSYQTPLVLKGELDRLKRVCEEEGIKQEEWGGRMHYLRWEHPTTIAGLESAGLSYDNTLGYADFAGFRCGTCFEYPAFDAINSKMLRIRIRPLIAMDVSLMSKEYMALKDWSEALSTLQNLKAICQHSGGKFTLLWHNSELSSFGMRKIYLEISSNDTY